MKKIELNANNLKLIAVAAMTIDHIADVFYPGFPALPLPFMMHLVGRLTALIMWFFVCEGFHYTKNVKKYMLRMFIFAVISHFAYCFAFGINPIPFSTGIFNQTSVMYPLFISVVVLWLQNEEKSMNKYLKNIIIFVLIWSAFPADWSCVAVLAILNMYRKRGDLKGQMREIVLWVFVYGLVSFFFVNKIYALELVGVFMVYPILKMYNGEKGKADWMKLFFYIYYPVHLVIIGIIRLWLYGNVSLLF
ncbi:MAG: TraX family protein [Erysipelotrichaceae bacterium]|jgi:hypothetical protein